MKAGDKEAKTIATQLLETTGETLLSGDFEVFATAFHIPHVIRTAEGNTYLNTTEELRVVFEEVRRAYELKGITHFIRHCAAATFKDDNTIHATHVSHNMAGDFRVGDPFPVFSVIERRADDIWRIYSSEYAENAETPRGRALMSSGKQEKGPRL